MWKCSVRDLIERHRFFSTDLKVRTKLHVFFITDLGVRGFSHLPPRRTPLEGRKSWSLKELLFAKAFQVYLQISFLSEWRLFGLELCIVQKYLGIIPCNISLTQWLILPCRFLVHSLKKKVCKTQEFFAWLVKGTRLKHFQIHVLVNM